MCFLRAHDTDSECIHLRLRVFLVWGGGGGGFRGRGRFVVGGFSSPLPPEQPLRQLRRLPPRRFQDLVSLHGFCTRVNHPIIGPPTCIARSIAILVHVHCAIYDAPPTPLCMSHTIQYWQWQYRVKANVCPSPPHPPEQLLRQ